jgi:hypothetical protein
MNDLDQISDDQLNRLSTNDLNYLMQGKLENLSDEALSVLSQQPAQSDVPDQVYNPSQYQMPKETTMAQKAIGAGEAALSTLTGIPASVVGAYRALPTLITQGQKPAEQQFERTSQSLTYQPRTELGQEYAGNVGEVLQQSGVQGLMGMPVQGARVPKIPSAKPSITSNVLGLTTGTGSEAIRQAFKAGKKGGESLKVLKENMRGEVPINLVLQDAKAALAEMKANKSADYVANRTGWAADTTKLDFAPIEQSFKSLEDSLKQGNRWKIGNTEQLKVKEVQQVINDWKRTPSLHTTVGLDALKQRIDAIYPDSPKQTQAQRVITGTSRAVKDAIVKQAPDYATAMKDYETMSSTIKDIESALSLGDRASKDTALRKLQSLTRNNVQTNYGGRLDMLNQLEQVGGENIMPAVSGQALSSITPRGLAGQSGASLAALAGYFNPSTLLTLPFTSPRLMGEAAIKAGQASRAVPSLPKVNYGLTPMTGLLGYQNNNQ